MEKTTTLFSSMIFCALVFAEDMVAGETAAEEEPKRRRRRDAMVAVFLGGFLGFLGVLWTISEEEVGVLLMSWR